MFKIMFYVSLVLAIFFLIISVVLFVRNNVAKLIGDVTGWNTRRAKKEFQKKSAEEYSTLEQNKSRNRSSGRNKLDRKKKMPILSKIEHPLFDEATTLLNEEKTTLLEEEATTLLAEEETTLLAEEATTLLTEEETTLLAEEATTLLAEEETTLLAEEATTLLAEEETTLLAEEATTLLTGEETTLLMGEVTASHMVENNYTAKNKDVMLENIFEVEESMMVTHTDDSIDE